MHWHFEETIWTPFLQGHLDWCCEKTNEPPLKWICLKGSLKSILHLLLEMDGTFDIWNILSSLAKTETIIAHSSDLVPQLPHLFLRGALLYGFRFYSSVDNVHLFVVTSSYGRHAQLRQWIICSDRPGSRCSLVNVGDGTEVPMSLPSIWSFCRTFGPEAVGFHGLEGVSNSKHAKIKISLQTMLQ